MTFKTRFGSSSHDRGTWLVLLFLLLGVIAPASCVLWFMNEAAKSQVAAARQSVTEAYRSQLPLLRDRVDANWQSVAVPDAIVVLNADSSVRDPAPMLPITADPVADRADWRAARTFEARRDRLTEAAGAYANIAKSEKDPSIAARAAQAQIRCLVQSLGERGDKEAAIRAILSAHFGKATDLQGRSIAADELLLAIHLLKPNDHRYQPAVSRLAALLNDTHAPMPTAQRLFLMSEMKPLAEFPSYEAERLAAQFRDSDGPGDDDTLEASRIPDVWKLTSRTRRVISLYRTDTVVKATSNLLGARFAMIPPGAATDAESIPAGPRLPGWRISFSLVDTKPFDDAARRRMTFYIWVGSIVIAAMAVTGLLLGQSFRRQLRLAGLKSDLVATVSHELKTPLSSMRLLVDTLLDDAVLDPKKTRDYLELISRENARLSLVISNFLAFSRMERNRYAFEFAPANVEDVVKAAVNAAGERFTEPGCELRIEIEPNLPEMRVDTGALVTAVVNLLDNAYKYTPGEKHITLRAFSANDGHSGGEICFEVSDNGIGIEPREIKRIFRKFYQADRRLSRVGGGCGLGLSIVRFLVEAHGGSVRVSSQLGNGSRFTVALAMT